MSPLDQFLRGAIAMGFAVAALFFLRYWRDSRDRFFAWFAAAFFVLAVNRLVLAWSPDLQENTVGPYLVRLSAFAVIIFAVLDKNLRRTGSS